MENEDSSKLIKKINELEKKVEKLEQINYLYKSAIDQLPFGIKIFDKNGYLYQINSRQKELLNIPGIEESIGVFNILTNPESKETGANQKYEKVYQGEPYEEEYEYDFSKNIKSWSNRADKRVIRENIFPVRNSEGNIEYVVDITQDKTEEKKAKEVIKEKEQKFRTLYENAPLAYQSLDHNGFIIDINPAWLNTLGYEKEEVLGRSFSDFLHPDWKPHFQKNFPEFKKRGSIHNVEFKMVHKDGHHIDTSFEGCIGYNQDGTFKQTYCVFKDITEEKQIEEQLKKSEQQNRKIVENINDAMFIHDFEGKISFVNENACRLLGYSREEMIGSGIEMFHGPHNIKAIIKRINEKSWYNRALFEDELIKKDGSKIPIEINTKKVSEEGNGEIHAFIRDISARKQAEAALKASERNFRLLFENSPLGIFIAYTDGTLIDVNKAMIEMLGSPSVEETKKINILKFPPLVEKGYAKTFRECIQDGTIKFLEHFYESKWGKSRYLSSYIIPLKDEKGDVEKIYTLVEDITDRKNAEKDLIENEEKFRSFINNSSDGIRLADENGQIIFVNDSHETLTGYSKEEVVGKWIWDFSFGMYPEENRTPEKYHRLKKKLNDVINGETNYLFNKPYVIDAQTKQGNRIKLQEAVFKIQTSKGIRYGSTIRDITKLKQQEEKLRELNATKDKFFSIISHDLRGPFQTILGFSQLALESAKKEEYSRMVTYANEIYKATQLSYNLLNNLLDWSRLQRGKMKYTPEIVELNSIINKALNLLKANRKEKNINLELSVDNNLHVFGDQFMLETILRNLISNAIKFTHNNGTITISATHKADGTQIIVKDTGVGIKKENIPKLFNIGNGYKTTGTNKEQGTGLGLTLCKEFVEKHGAKLEVESEEGKGSAFWFTIPDTKK
jgi:PAS domain S-box-containing protein